jgi:hypothetical protein
MQLLRLHIRISSFDDQQAVSATAFLSLPQVIAVKGRATLRGAGFPKMMPNASLIIRECVRHPLGNIRTSDTRTIFAP